MLTSFLASFLSSIELQELSSFQTLLLQEVGQEVFAQVLWSLEPLELEQLELVELGPYWLELVELGPYWLELLELGPCWLT